MAYATGSATTASQIIDAINSFATANGWTLDYAGADGSEKRLHISKGICHANFSSNYVSATNIFGMNGSGGFIGSGTAWDLQTAPRSSTFACLKISGTFAILPCTYYLFANGDNLSGVFVGANNTSQSFHCGTVTKVGTYSGGDYYSTNNFGLSMANNSSDSPSTPANFNIRVPTTGFITPVVLSNGAAYDLNTAMTPLAPVRIFDATTTGSSQKLKPLGYIPAIREMQKGLNMADEVVYGTDTWKVFFDIPTAVGMIALLK